MKQSLQSKMLYGYIAVIVVLLVGVLLGTSVLIRGYFIASKRQELTNKGFELARVVDEYYQNRINYNQFSNFINSVDNFLDARIWVVDSSGKLVAASASRRDHGISGMGPGRTGGPGGGGQGQGMRGMRVLMNELDDILAGKVFTQTFYNPYYEETMLMVAVPFSLSASGTAGAIVLNSPIKGINDFMQTIYYYIAAVGLIALCLTVVAVKWLAGGVIRPLKDMKNTAQAMAGGDYETRVTVDTDDEVGELGRSLNALAEDLSAFVHKTRLMEKMRRDFVANVSHELRTPLTIIRGYNEALLDGTVNDPELANRYYQVMRDETVRLERLIKDLLDLSRLQSGGISLEREALSLAEVVQGVCQMFRQKIDQKEINLIVDNSPDLPQVYGSGDRLTQLVVILLDNALHHTPAGGSIKISTEESDTHIVLKIIDSGTGIPAEDLPYIWERFYKVDKAHKRTEAGTGLGLAIAREIIDLHGATVEVESFLGLGTTFSIRFPLSFKVPIRTM